MCVDPILIQFVTVLHVRGLQAYRAGDATIESPTRGSLRGCSHTEISRANLDHTWQPFSQVRMASGWAILIQTGADYVMCLRMYKKPMLTHVAANTHMVSVKRLRTTWPSNNVHVNFPCNNEVCLSGDVDAASTCQRGWK